MVFNRLFEQRAISYQTLFANGEDLELGTTAGVVVNDDTALTINAVFAAVSLYSDTVSTLPIDVYIRRDGARYAFRPAPEWVYKPDTSFTKEAFYSSVITSLLLDGNAFIRIYSNSRGEIVNLVVLNPSTVEIRRNGLGRLQFIVSGEEEPIQDTEMVYIPDLLRPGHLRGTSRIESLKENFALSIALERFAAQFFGAGVTMSGIIEFPGNLTQEQADSLARGVDRRHGSWKKAHRTGVLSGGAKFVSTQNDPEKAMLVDSRNQAVADVARAFALPPHLLGLDQSTSYASIEQQNIAFVQHSIRPLVQKIEGALSPLMARYQGGEDAFIKFNLDNLVRADLAARTSAYASALQSGWASVNDIRRWEDIRPIDDPSADTVRVPLANVNIEAATLSAETERVKMAQQLIQVGFEPSEVLKSLGLPPIAHTGVPTTQLQQVSTIDPASPSSVYEVE
jgi:HK97 family phage portal protein